MDKNDLEKKNERYNILIFLGLFFMAGIILLFVFYAICNNSYDYQQGSSMPQTEKDIYNSKIKPYVNEGVKGSEIKSMIDEIIDQNNNYIGEVELFIGIMIEDNESLSNYSAEEQNTLREACEEASAWRIDGNRKYFWRQ